MQKFLLALVVLLLGVGAAHAQVSVGAFYIGYDPTDFGTVAVNSTTTISSYVQTGGSTIPIEITVGVTGSGYSITGGTCLGGAQLDPPSDSCTIDVTFQPTAPGAASGNLVINCAPLAAVGGVTLNCSTTPGSDLATTIPLQGTAVGAAALPSLGRVGLSLLALLVLGLAVFSMRRHDPR